MSIYNKSKYVCLSLNLSNFNFHLFYFSNSKFITMNLNFFMSNQNRNRNRPQAKNSIIRIFGVTIQFSTNRGPTVHGNIHCLHCNFSFMIALLVPKAAKFNISNKCSLIKKRSKQSTTSFAFILDGRNVATVFSDSKRRLTFVLIGFFVAIHIHVVNVAKRSIYFSKIW